MACRTSFRSRSRPDGGRVAAIGSRVLMSIAIIAVARFEVIAAFVEGAGTGSNVPSGARPAGAPIESVAGAVGELESWDNGFDLPDACARRRSVAEACAACPDLAPALGISAWQCCGDAGAQRVCFEIVAAALVDRAAAMAATDDGSDQDDDEEDAIEKRAKYFLGKRAKYFLGKRAFGARRMGGYRPATRHELLSDEFAVLGAGRRAHGDRQVAAEKRAKYFLG